MILSDTDDCFSSFQKYKHKTLFQIVQSVDAAKLGLELGYIDQEYFTNLKCLAQEIADKFK